jgi:type VI secretion system protein VasD
MRDRDADSPKHTLRTCAAVIAMLFTLAGCTASKKMMQIAKDPNTPVGELRDQPSQVALSMVASKDMNPNVYQPVEASVPGTELPYSVSLSGDDLADLAQQLKVTLKQVQGEMKATASAEVASSIDDEVPDGEADTGETEADVAEDHSEMSADESDVSDMAAQDESGLVEETEADATEEAVAATEVEDHGDGVPRQVGQYREARGGDTDDEQARPDARSGRNANPVEVTVYQLKDDGRFLSADFDQLRADPKQALGKTYLEHDDFVMRPGQFKFVRFFPVKEQAQFIAVVASYEDIDSIVWKAIARIEPTGGRYPLLVSLGKHGVRIQKED